MMHRENKITRTLFPFSLHRGFLEVERILLTKVEDRDITNSKKRTPLHYAAKDGHADIVHLLLEKGVEIDYRVSNLGENVKLKGNICRNHIHVDTCLRRNTNDILYYK